MTTSEPGFDRDAAASLVEKIATEEWDPYKRLDSYQYGICDGCAEQKSLAWEWEPSQAWLCEECHDGDHIGALVVVARSALAALVAVEQERDQLRAENQRLRDAIDAALRTEMPNPERKRAAHWISGYTKALTDIRSALAAVDRSC